MTDIIAKLDAIEAGLEGVTPGPWEVKPTAPIVVGVSHSNLSGIAGLSVGIGRTYSNTAHFSRLDPDTVRELVRMARIGASIESTALENRYRAMIMASPFAKGSTDDK